MVFVTGQKRYDGVMEQLSRRPLRYVVVKPYIPNMPEVLPKVAAMSVEPGQRVSRKLRWHSIYPDSKSICDADHQTKNALSPTGAAEIISEADLTGTRW